MILRRETYRRVAWPNGGGLTDDILVDPGPRPLRRISLATIARDGPFSDFSGYDRSFVLAAGAGVELRPAAAEPVVLDRPGAVHRFAGETPMACALLVGQVRAFNVFTRRDALRADVRVERIAAGTTWSPADAAFVFVIAGALESAAGPLRRRDTLALAPATLPPATSSPDAAAWLRATPQPLRATEDALVVAVRFAAR